MNASVCVGARNLVSLARTIARLLDVMPDDVTGSQVVARQSIE